MQASPVSYQLTCRKMKVVGGEHAAGWRCYMLPVCSNSAWTSMCAVLWQGNMVPPMTAFPGNLFFLYWRERDVVEPPRFDSQLPGGCTVRHLYHVPSWAASPGPPLPSVVKILRSPLLLPALCYHRVCPTSGHWCQLLLHQSSFVPFLKSRAAEHPEE